MQLRDNQAALFTRLTQVREGTLGRTEEAAGLWHQVSGLTGAGVGGRGGVPMGPPKHSD